LFKNGLLIHPCAGPAHEWFSKKSRIKICNYRH
jgi:hypothetical protein